MARTAEYLPESDSSALSRRLLSASMLDFVEDLALSIRPALHSHGGGLSDLACPQLQNSWAGLMLKYGRGTCMA